MYFQGINFGLIIGAAVIGALGAAGMYLVDHCRQQNIRNANVIRLQNELSKVREDLQQFRSKKSLRRRLKGSGKAHSIFSATTDGYISVASVCDSDSEFYDCSDEESSNESCGFNAILKRLDKELDMGNEEVLNVWQQIEDLCLEYPNNVELLYRIAKAHHKLADASEDQAVVRRYLNKGIEACSSAFNIAYDHVEVHKWYSILIGCRTKLASIRDKLDDALICKKHLDIAMSLNSDDPFLHYMLGRFDYELADLSWFESTLASSLSGGVLSATYEEACTAFLEAERLWNRCSGSRTEGKDNTLMIAKCKIGMREYAEVVEWLEKAYDADKTGDNIEINTLLQKYRGF